MPYTLYITDGCQSCERVAARLIAAEIRFREINLSDAKAKHPQGVIVVPALFKDGALLAYGPDILALLPLLPVQ